MRERLIILSIIIIQVFDLVFGVAFADEKSFSFCVVADARCSEKVDPNYPDQGDGVKKFAALAKKIAGLRLRPTATSCFRRPYSKDGWRDGRLKRNWPCALASLRLWTCA